MENNIIMVRGLGFDYGDGWVFHKLNLDIAEGDFVAVIGANGAGKSTLLKMLAHAMPPTVGEIYYYGKPVEEFRQITSVAGCINPYAEYDAFIAQADNPDLRFFISNTTEAGIAYHE